MKLEQVLVVGAGQMGGGIAQVVAASGRRVSLHDAVPGAVERALETMRKSLARLAEKDGAEPDEVLGRIQAVDDLVPADLMIEAVVEDADVKAAIFRQADGVLPPQAILASNTSSIPITSLAAGGALLALAAAAAGALLLRRRRAGQELAEELDELLRLPEREVVV